MSQLPSSSESSSLGGDDAPAPTVKAKSKKMPKRRATDDSQPASGGRGAGCVAALLNLLTAALLLLTVAGLALFLLLFQFPDVLRFVPGGSAYMPPTELPIAQALSSPTPVSAGSGQTFPTLPPVWTPTDTPTITPTPQPGTPSPEPSGTLPVPTYTATSTPTRTPTATRPSPTPAYKGPTPTASSTRSSQPYTLQPGSPAYLTNFLNDSGCNWFGVAGRAFGLDGNPVINLTVHLEGGSINVDVVTGSGPTAMGPGSYVIPLSDHPIDTTDIYKVQLRNNSGTPLSTIYSLNTFGNCAKNLIMVNFVQNH